MFIFYIALFVWPFAALGIWSLIIGQLILTVIVFTHQQNVWWGNGEPSFLGWLFGGLVPYGIVLVTLGYCYGSSTERKTELAESIPLISLSPEVGVDGNFALGYGSVGSDPIYLSKRQNKDGGYENFIIGGKTFVYEDVASKDKATLQVFRSYSRESRRAIPAWARYIMKEDEVGDWQPVSEQNRIHVPKGTVMRDFKA